MQIFALQKDTNLSSVFCHFLHRSCQQMHISTSQACQSLVVANQNWISVTAQQIHSKAIDKYILQCWQINICLLSPIQTEYRTGRRKENMLQKQEEIRTNHFMIPVTFQFQWQPLYTNTIFYSIWHISFLQKLNIFIKTWSNLTTIH